MVNWKSHSNTQLRFSPGTNLLIGSMGSGKTSCLDAVCFAFFGSFPSLKSRQVNLTDVLMSRPDKKQSGLVEVEFNASGKTYTATRTVSAKGTEAFLRCDGMLLEGPQPIRTTEAVSRLLKLDYDTFVRVVYGEQNKLDYFFTLAKGARKTQLDDLLGISLFETVRVACNAVSSKLKTEKTSLDSFMSSVDIASLESELAKIRQSLNIAVQSKTSLESTIYAASLEFETVKKNLESLQELQHINEEMSMQLVKTRAEAESLHSSAVSIMPSSLAGISREQCASLLEQCASALQERSDLEREVNDLNTSIQRIEGEAAVLRQVVEQYPVEKLKQGVSQLLESASQLESASTEFLELTKRASSLGAAVSALQSELSSIAGEASLLSSKTASIKSIQAKFTSMHILEEELRVKRNASLELERSKAAKLEVLSTLEKSLSLLQGENVVCPTCDQSIAMEALPVLIGAKSKLLQGEKENLQVIDKQLSQLSTALTELSTALSTWVELLPASTALATLMERGDGLSTALVKARNDLSVVNTLLEASVEKLAALKGKTDKLESIKEKLHQSEKSSDRLTHVEKELALLKENMLKKHMALGMFDERQKLESKLEELRSAFKAFELFEKTEALKKRQTELKEKLAGLQFEEAELELLRSKSTSLFSKIEASRVSLNHLNSEVKEKTEFVSRLDAQLSRLSMVKKNSDALSNGVHNLAVFQNSVVETQGELRTELITAVNAAMHEVWRNVYPYRDYSSCRVVATDDDYLVEVLAVDGWKPVEQCSGGEKTCAALSLRVSLAMVLLPNLSWLVLDEPTHNLDSQGVNLLARALHETLPTIVRQTFVVTHDEALKEGASGTVFYFNRDKDKGEATTVEILS